MESSVIYGLESQGRALCSHTNDTDSIRFFVGTLSPRSNGQIHQLDYEDETNKLTRKIYSPNIGEIWSVHSSPTASELLGICYNHIHENSAHLRASIWKLPFLNSGTENQDELEHIFDLSVSSESNEFKGEVKTLDFHPSKNSQVASVLENSLHIWSIDSGGKCKIRESYNSPSKSIYSGKWNPHLDGNQFALLLTTAVSGVDMRTMKEAWSVPKAHKFQVRDCDFNPNKQYYFATCGDDCTTKFWDFRNALQPIKTIQTHTHWVWRVRYNSFHDQLVLTSGSDSRVVLHSVTSISSEPKGHIIFSDSEEETEHQTTPLEDGILAKYEEHEDAVYAVEWSNYDAWTFASLSYDGRVVINHVPKSQKYKIFL